MDLDRAVDLVVPATQDVFQTMLESELRVAHCFEHLQPIIPSEITALIGLAGDRAGSVSLHCTQDQGRAFTARLLGMEPHEVDADDDIRDALGEIVNMVAGNVKTALAGTGTRVDISLPTVVMTSKPDIRIKAGSSQVIEFDGPQGTFSIELVLTEPQR